MDLIRVLFVSDTHLGFDLPRRPRVERRRRGPDFFENFERALEPARRGEVDLVIHGGDILFRSRVPADLVARAFEPLKQVAESGVPVYVVPGNHERSRIPYALLAQHENLFLFDRPKTYLWKRQGFTLALAGFPYERQIRERFPAVVDETGWRGVDADAKLLLMHHAVEGARVGPADYTFTSAADVVRTADIPQGFTAVLSGHIHRAQVLTRDLGGRPLPTPILYPGSVERTSFAEKDERKGYLTFALERSGELRGWRFHELPARPMVTIELGPRELARDNLAARLRRRLEMLPEDAVVQLKIDGPVHPVPKVLGAASLRALAPSSMNVTISVTPGDRWRRPSSRTERF